MRLNKSVTLTQKAYVLTKRERNTGGQCTNQGYVRTQQKDHKPRREVSGEARHVVILTLNSKTETKQFLFKLHG